MNLLESLLGTTDVSSFAAAYLFGLIGAFLSLRFQAVKRDKKSEATPEHFSTWFLLSDNALRILTSMLLVFIGIRFAKELLGMDGTVYSSLVIGFGIDKISQALKDLSKRK